MQVQTDKLDEIFSLQKVLQVRTSQTERYPEELDAKLSCLCTAIIHEAVELQRTTNWKWWKTPIVFDITHAKEELIDIWHFVVQASLEMGLTPEQILEEYKRKNVINHKRISDGY